MIRWIFGIVLAVCIGLSLGLIGGGGSVLAVPVLVYVMGLPEKEAIASTLLIVGVVSLIGAIPHWKQGNVNLKVVASFAPSAMLGAFFGARIANLPAVTGTIQLVAFGITTLLASLLMIRKSSSRAPKVEPVTDPPLSASELDPKSFPNGGDVSSLELTEDQATASWTRWLIIAIEGLAVGVLTGFVGVGGGFAIIPALVLLGGIPMKEAIGTSLLIITLNSASAFAGYLGQVTLNWNLIMAFTLAASVGTVSGALLNKSIDAKHLQKGFGYFVLAVAVYVLIRR